MLTAEQMETFKRDGFLHLKGVFDPQEIQRFANLGRSRTDSEILSVSLNLIPELSQLCFDDRILSVAKELLNSQVSYFFESNYVRYGAEYLATAQGHLHHDGKGAPTHLFNRLHQSFTQPYPVVRFGIYLQDTENLSGGLKICPGSHLSNTSSFEGDQLRYYDVPSQPGDLICFCLRVLHSPFARRQKQAPLSAMAPWDENLLLHEASESLLPAPNTRETIFIDFAGTDDLSDLHIKSRALNPNNRKPGLANAFLSGALGPLISRPEVQFRYDYAIVDTLFEIEKNAINGKLKKSGFEYIKQLVNLCALNKEFSSSFPFTPQIEEESYSLSDAIQMVNTIRQKFTAYSGQIGSKDRDEHMGRGYHPSRQH